MSNSPLELNISKGFVKQADGSVYSYSQGPQSVSLQKWSGSFPDGQLVTEADLTYDEYGEFRRAHPSLGLPDLGPPANGNTIGRVVGQPAAPKIPASQANPPVETETSAEAGTGTKVLDGLQLGLDVVGLIPGFGEVADLANAGISAARGDYVSAGISLASAVPFVGWVATGAKLGKRGAEAAGALNDASKLKTAGEAAFKAGDEVGEQAAKHSDSAAKQADEAGSAGKGGQDGGKVKKRGKCVLRPYVPDTCKAEGKTGHHVVPDRAFRQGKRSGPERNQIPGGLSEAEGLVICVEGATPTPTNEHGKIHRLYNAAEKAIGLAGTPPGTAPISALEAAGAAAVGQVLGCNPAQVMAQLRAYHEAKGLSSDFKVRADERGTLSRKLPPDTFGTPGPGEF